MTLAQLEERGRAQSAALPLLTHSHFSASCCPSKTCELLRAAALPKLSGRRRNAGLTPLFGSLPTLATQPQLDNMFPGLAQPAGQ